jgi:capsular exopolysaccharide synthesis family protein
MTEQSRLYLTSIEANDRRMNELKMQLSSLGEVEKYVTSKSGDSRMTLSTYNVSDPTLNQLVSRLATAESDYERLRKTTAENNPMLQSIQNEISSLRPSILENVRNQKKSVEAGLSLLNQSSNQYLSMLNTVPRKERDLVNVSRQKEIISTTYAFLLQKREETASSISTRIPDCTFVSYPLSSVDPVSPKKLLLGIAAMVIPFLLGYSVIILKEMMNTNILFRSDIEKLTTFPVIGELIHEKDSETLVTAVNRRSFIVEQFRQVRTALLYQLNRDVKKKRIVVTSSIKGEGKSFVSSNLAVSIARSGKKVALLEMDLHQPTLSKAFKVDAMVGISDFLINEATEEEIIVPTSVAPNLFLVPAGNLVSEPSELLLNGRLEKLLAYLDKQFDVVLVDTAPVKALTDAYTIASHCHLILYIVRHNHTPKVLIEQLDEDMEAYDHHSVAIIFNGVKNRGWGRKAYGQGYGYGYSSRSSYDTYHKKKKTYAA